MFSLTYVKIGEKTFYLKGLFLFSGEEILSLFSDLFIQEYISQLS